MKIAKVIHGYPPLYNAGSEVYSQTLVHALCGRGHEVAVFSREEDSFRPDGAMRTVKDGLGAPVTIHLVNNPRHRDRYQVDGIDQRFGAFLDRFRPDIVHFGHLNHLSVGMVGEASQRAIPVIYTLHDYWLMCPRGQFMQMHSPQPWEACTGQEDSKCATRCYARYFGGVGADVASDMAYWTDWVRRRMAHIRYASGLIDVFIAPSLYLKARFEADFGLPKHKTHYLPYGFDRKRLAASTRLSGEPFVFGYIGTHIPAKGINHLIEAFSMLQGAAILRIWGRERGQDTASLKRLGETSCDKSELSIEWMGEYCNENIARDVFSRTDAIVCPSVWVENSPLVIHEALQARKPVVTANAGGMAELVRHGENGLLFDHRNPTSLADCMQRMLDDPEAARALGERGYLGSPSGDVPDSDSHAVKIEAIYDATIRSKREVCHDA